MARRHPNFIIGGTAAGGTSFLAALLVQHPEIYLPREMRPEPHYFYKSWEYQNGLDYYLDRWFAAVPDVVVAIGERSSSYLFGETAVAEKIYNVYPRMKLIFTLRNPIERTWANYRYTALQGLEDASFLEALEKEPDRIAAQEGVWAEIQPHNYTGRGLYGRQLRAFHDLFPRDQILLIKSETLSANTREELARVYEFLGLNDRKFVPIRAPDHTSVSVRDPVEQKELRTYFGDRFDKVIEATRKEQGIDRFVRNAEDRSQIQRLKSNLTGQKTPMPPDCRSYLQSFFEDDMKLLREYIDFDISDWR